MLLATQSFCPAIAKNMVISQNFLEKNSSDFTDHPPKIAPKDSSSPQNVGLTALSKEIAHRKSRKKTPIPNAIGSIWDERYI